MTDRPLLTDVLTGFPSVLPWFPARSDFVLSPIYRALTSNRLTTHRPYAARP